LTKEAIGAFHVGPTGGRYRLSVRNVGTAATSGPITCTDPLPPGLSYVYGGGHGWTCRYRDRTITCTFEHALAPGEECDMVLDVAVASAAMPSVENVATAETADQRSSSSATAVTAVRLAAPAPALSTLGVGAAVLTLVVVGRLRLRRRLGIPGPV
jgi:uncharacterized repeat protein (TIGR01451 family)